MEVNKSKEEQEPGQQTGSARMNNQHAPTAMTESRERLSSARLYGRWLMVARGVWITLVILTLAIFFASLPVYIALLQTLCAGTECVSGALLTPFASRCAQRDWPLSQRLRRLQRRL